MEKEIPNSHDVLVFTQVAELLGADQSLQVIAERLGVPASTISQCLRRLEAYYGLSLVARSPRRGTGELTPAGKRLYPKYRSALDALQRLTTAEAGAKAESFAIACTNAIRAHVLLAPVSAHMLWLESEGLKNLITLRVDELDYPDLIAELRRGSYPFVCGWALDRTVYPDIVMTDLMTEQVNFNVIIGPPVLREKERNASNALDRLFDQRDSIQLDELIVAARGKTLAAVRHEYDPALSSLAAAVGPAQITRVESYESVLSSIMMGLADFGWVPQFYRWHQHVQQKKIVDKNGDPIGRKIQFYDLAQKVDVSSAAEELRMTIRAFMGQYGSQVASRETLIADTDVRDWATARNAHVNAYKSQTALDYTV